MAEQRISKRARPPLDSPVQENIVRVPPISLWPSPSGGDLGVTPTGAITQNDFSASFGFIPCKGIEVVVKRSAGSKDGAVDPADAVWVRDLRRTVRRGLDRFELPDIVDNAELLVSELVTNAFRHGHGDVRVRMLFEHGRMRLEVRDGSHELPELRAADVLEECGRGLFIVRALADDWGISADGTTTWCSLNLYPLDHAP
ncbi:ATP-binding protein [Streptomyces sp. NPDC060205]|uniref:ATP-binding protein n=1 Tax=Streptomyces sp. NPDC060205 TaxID=3347072 RepID=UPI00365F9BE1